MNVAGGISGAHLFALPHSGVEPQHHFFTPERSAVAYCNEVSTRGPFHKSRCSVADDLLIEMYAASTVASADLAAHPHGGHHRILADGYDIAVAFAGQPVRSRAWATVGRYRLRRRQR
jgi:hypothetical protein